jgi:hypothetical protein
MESWNTMEHHGISAYFCIFSGNSTKIVGKNGNFKTKKKLVKKFKKKLN